MVGMRASAGWTTTVFRAHESGILAPASPSDSDPARVSAPGFKMKASLKLFSLCIGVILAGCKDLLFEDPESFLTTESFYTTAAELETATLAIYHALRSPFAGGGLGVV